MSGVRQDAVVVAVHLIVALLLLNPGYLVPDSLAVYSYLRSLVFDGDLLFFNEWGGFGMIRDGVTLYKEITPVGALANHWWVGTSILSAPAYLTAHLFAGETANGFSGLYAFVLSWMTIAFATAVSLLTLRIIRQDAPKLSTQHSALSTPSLLFCFAGTPLIYYTLRYPLGTHLAGAFCVAMICFYLQRLSGEEERFTALLVGLWCGLAVATRLQHLLLGPAVLFFLVASKKGKAIPWVVGGALLPVAVQAAAWQAIYGHPLGPLASGASHAGTTWMPLTRNAMLTVLFDSYHGLLSWSPVLILAIVGWFAEMRGERQLLAATFLLMFAGEWIANGLLDRYFWGGLSFGGRRFIDLALPFAVGMYWCLRRWPRASLMAGSVATTWNLLLAAAATVGSLDLSVDVSFGTMLHAVRSTDISALSGIGSPLLHGRAVGAFLGALLIVALVSVLLASFGRKPRLSAAALSIFLAFGIGVIFSVIPRNREHAAQWRKMTGVDDRRSARLGPLFDEKYLLTQELAFLRNRGRRREAQGTVRDLAAVDAAIREASR
jgi:hypothetical protein